MIMHQPIHTPAQEPRAIVPVQPGHLTAQTAAQPQPLQPNHRYGPLHQQTVQQGDIMSARIHQHSPILEAVGDQSLRSWYNCRETAGLVRQQAFAAVDQATTVDQEIAQLNRSIQQQLQQFDSQLKASGQTLRQEVAQKVGQYHRHMQQESNRCRNRLNLDEHAQPAWTSAHRNQAQRLFQSTTLR